MNNIKYNFNDFLKIMKKLISKDGCPWDKVQTHESLKKYMIEECYEVLDAVDNNDDKNLCEELGDVLLQVVFHAQIAENRGAFNINDVINNVSEKMINRHPHIFSDACADTPEEVLDNWESIKKREKGYNSKTDILKSVPKSLPALIRAEKVQKKASMSKFDFDSLDSAFEKLYEETEELKAVINKSDSKKMEEFGDLLFSAVNISRFLKLNPEFALTNAIEKFINRFEYIENALSAKGIDLEDADLTEIDALWNESKNKEEL